MSGGNCYGGWRQGREPEVVYPEKHQDTAGMNGREPPYPRVRCRHPYRGNYRPAG